ncbi:very short patch repair endonuclease [Chitinivibrio alkaliphilus]|uniref:Very short patch repair endonuclease n=1 Tax=Chitinivibrio alkaliphilus ACht1 TaxID=1313304 RepID=U7D7X9_9BACT|nr:very short patch repair endonuclease [Chitinivibrio alkaliphilus]ERP39060.1 DNA mismatch endonuclease vsr [Chitinivibrio alkaliphilus ACht1]
MDSLTPEKRSWNMSRIRSKNTKIEKEVRTVLHKMGYRYRINPIDILGKPDIFLRKYNTAIFVHGCFWHRHQGCKYAYTPKSNIEFWDLKFKKNINRDNNVKSQIEKMGINYLVVWECELRDIDKLKKRLENMLIKNVSCRTSCAPAERNGQVFKRN